MIGAILGDIIGSRFERRNTKSKDFELFTKECCPTDDSYMTFAVAKAIVESEGDLERLGECAVKSMQEIGRANPYAGFGGMFYKWLFSENPMPYNSLGNGAGMRVSPVAFVAKTLDECKNMSRIVTEATHNHPEGIRGAEAIAVSTWLLLHGAKKEEIRKTVCENYYTLDFTIDEIRPKYKFDVTCMGSVPQAIEAFLESESFEDAIRTAVSIGGDSDTIAAMTGALAESFYGVPNELYDEAKKRCPPDLFKFVEMCYK